MPSTVSVATRPGARHRRPNGDGSGEVIYTSDRRATTAPTRSSTRCAASTASLCTIATVTVTVSGGRPNRPLRWRPPRPSPASTTAHAPHTARREDRRGPERAPPARPGPAADARDFPLARRRPADRLDDTPETGTPEPGPARTSRPSRSAVEPDAAPTSAGRAGHHADHRPDHRQLRRRRPVPDARQRPPAAADHPQPEQPQLRVRGQPDRPGQLLRGRARCACWPPTRCSSCSVAGTATPPSPGWSGAPRPTAS